MASSTAASTIPLCGRGPCRLLRHSVRRVEAEPKTQSLKPKAQSPNPMRLSRRTYADHFGPTTGDRVRLADTELIVRVERDCATLGDEAKFGGGKVIRDGM